MGNSEVRKILQTRMLEYRGYKNKSIRVIRLKHQVVGNIFTFAPILVMGLFVIASFIIGLTFLSKSGTLTADLSDVKDSSFGSNWSKMLKDDRFKSAIKNSMIIVLIVTFFTVFFPIIITSFLNLGKVKFRRIFQIAYFLPLVTADIAATIVFVTMGEKFLHLGSQPQNYFWVVVIVMMWMQSASAIVTYNTAFTNVGQVEYEAASLDGANAFTKFFKITLPSLSPIIVYQTIMSIIFSMTAFGQSYSLIAMQYVTGNDINYVVLWPVVGFLRVIGNSGIMVNNIGMGMIELTLLGLTVLGLSLIANFVQPIKGRR